MLLYVTLGSNNITLSLKFYDAALKPLGMKCDFFSDDELGYGRVDRTVNLRECILWIGRPFLKLPATWGNGTMIALAALNRKSVDAFYEAGLAKGGFDEGAPGLRPYHANFYAAYLRDPDGNKLSAVCEVAEGSYTNGY